MFDRKKFKAKVALAGMTLDVVAKEIGINPATLDRKMSGISDFYRSEIQKIRKLLNLSPSEVEDIFFAEELT